MSEIRTNKIANTSGVEKYLAQAWVDFDGVTAGTPIRGSGNVTSITDNGVGDYTVNFTTAMPDANYAALVSLQSSVSGTGGLSRHTSQTVSAYRFLATDAGPNAADFSRVRVVVFR